MEEKRLVPKRRFAGFTEEWEERTLGELGKFGKTYSYSRAQEGPGEYYHIHYGDIHTRFNGIIEKNTLVPSISVKNNYELLNNGDVVIADASEDFKDLGKTVVIEDVGNRKIIAGLHTFKFTPNKYLNSAFYLYYSQSDLFKKFAYRTGTGISVFGISRENIYNMELKLPTYLEQQKIGSFFKNLDETIAIQQYKLEKTKALKSAYLAEMFPAEGERVPKRRFAGFTGEWEKRRIMELGEINTGSTPSTSEIDNYSNNGLIWVTPSDINGAITTQTARRLSEKGEKLGVVVPPQSILITSIASIGKNTMVNDYASFNQQINSLSPKKENDPYFLLTQSYFWSKQMKSIAGSGTVQIVNRKLFSEMYTYTPSFEEQQKIGNFFKQLDDKITNEQRKLNKLKALKQAYLHEMFV